MVATLRSKKLNKTLYAFMFRVSGEMAEKPVPCWVVLTSSDKYPTPQGYTLVQVLTLTHNEDAVEKELKTKVLNEASRTVPKMSVKFDNPPCIHGGL
ncbi:MAG: hypothetical protein ACPGO5_01510 [Patescibacteria group bacterium]